jgi:hypothetical protein
MKRKTVLVLIAAVHLVSAGISKAGLTGYVGTGEGYIYYIDFETGQYTEAYHGSLGEVCSLELDGNFIYAAGINRFYKIDIATGEEVFWESVGDNLESLAMAPNGILYGVQENNLVIVDKETGGITEIGYISPSISVLAIDRNGRAIGFADTVQPLVEVNLSDASITHLGCLSPSGYGAFDFGPDGNLYGWNLSDLYRIDIDALTSTFAGHYALSGEGFVLVPEPATVLLLGFGAVIMRKLKT